MQLIQSALEPLECEYQEHAYEQGECVDARGYFIPFSAFEQDARTILRKCVSGKISPSVCAH